MVLSAFAACSDDAETIGTPGPGTQLVIQPLTLTTAEDAQVTASIVFSHAAGPTTLMVSQQAAHGTVSISGSTLTYRPDPDYAGADEATISGTDRLGTVTSTVVIDVTPINDVPRLIANPTMFIDEDTTLTFSSSSSFFVDIDTPFSAIAVTLQPGSGYTVTNQATLQPAANFNGNLEAAVIVNDGSGPLSFNVPVTVRAVNDAPVNVVPGTQSILENATKVFDASALVSVSDVDATELTIQLAADHGTITLAATTGLTFVEGDGTADASLTFTGSKADANAALLGMSVTPANAYNGLLIVALTSNDDGATGIGGPLSDTDTITIGVGDVAFPPVISGPATAATDEDTALTFLTANRFSVADIDAVATDVLQVRITAAQGAITFGALGGAVLTGSGADVTISGVLTAINTALGGLVYMPPANFSGAVTLTLVATSDGETDTALFAITVNAVNDAPTVTAPASIGALVNTTVAFASANAVRIADIDAVSPVQLTIDRTSGTLAFPASPLTPTAVDADTLAFSGTLADINAALAVMTWTPASATFTGNVTLTFTVNDQGSSGSGGPLTGARTTTIVVDTAHQPPVALADSYSTHGNMRLVVPGPANLATLLANDTDVDFNTLTVVSNTAPTQGMVVMNANGTFTYTPPVGLMPGLTGPAPTATFTYTVQDADGDTDTATVTITLLRGYWFVDKASTVTPRTGSSTAPFATIGDAAAAAQPGSSVFVFNAPSAYTETGAIALRSSVELLGQGTAALNLGPNGTIPLAASPSVTLSSAIQAAGTNHISGLALQGSVDGIASSSALVVDHVTFSGFTTAVALPSSVGTSSISDASFTGGGAAVSYGPASPTTRLNVDRVTISDATIAMAGPAGQLRVRDTTLNGAAVASPAIVIDGAVGAEVELTNVSVDGYTGAALDLRGGANVLLQNNRFVGSAAGTFATAVISVEATSGNRIDLTSVDNTLATSGNFGLAVTANATVCLDLGNTSASAATFGYTLAGAGPTQLDAYVDGGDLATYFAGRSVTGTFGFTPAEVTSGTCAAPPTLN